MAENRGPEAALYIETLYQHRRHRYTATAGDAVHRHPVRLESIWLDYDAIPDEPDPTLLLDNATAGVVALRKLRLLAPMAGTTRKFEVAGDPAAISRVVIATHGQVAPLAGSVAPTLRTPPTPAGGYAPVLVDAAGGVHPMSPGIWIVDGLNHFVEFPYGIPATMPRPFRLTFFEYLGLLGGGVPHVWERVADAGGYSVGLNLAFPTAVTDDVVFPAQDSATNPRFVFGTSTGSMFVGPDSWTPGRHSVMVGSQSINPGAATRTGGIKCSSSGQFSTICGGINNRAPGFCSCIGGGEGSQATRTCSAVGGGTGGNAFGNYSVVLGGAVNIVLGSYSSSSGGLSNSVLPSYSRVCGNNNLVNSGALYSVILCGFFNAVSGVSSVIHSGHNMRIGSSYATILGGYDDTAGSGASASHATRLSGNACGVSALFGTLLGGVNCTVSGAHATIGGGKDNVASGAHSTIAGGEDNVASAAHAHIPGGSHNRASGAHACACGIQCVASKDRAFAGGGLSTANGVTSLAFGTVASSGNYNNTVTLCDRSALTAAANNGYYAGFEGGYTLYTNPLRTLGASLGSGLSAWAAVSDRAAKENLHPLEGVLERLEAIPVYEYNYKGTAPDLVCRGPVAQDWHAAFPSAKDPLRIDTMDLDGVALAAIKELASAIRDLRGGAASARQALAAIAAHLCLCSEDLQPN